MQVLLEVWLKSVIHDFTNKISQSDELFHGHELCLRSEKEIQAMSWGAFDRW